MHFGRQNSWRLAVLVSVLCHSWPAAWQAGSTTGPPLSLSQGFMAICGVLALSGQAQAEEPAPVYIADALANEISSAQDWGKLGRNTEAVSLRGMAANLRIKDKSYQRGLGHHANGEIVVPLDGRYKTFECEAGIQWQGGKSPGSVVFQVFVDDEKVFDSGVMHENDPAQAVRVSVARGIELRLVATDAGDGIGCDGANWAEARLVPDSQAKNHVIHPPVDIARFARVVTSDPNRIKGTVAKRDEEMPADDIFLAKELKPGPGGSYTVPLAADGRSAFGLEWCEMRLLRCLELDWAEAASQPPADAVQLQYWVGFQGRGKFDLWIDNSSCPWNGDWRPLEAKLEQSPGVWRWKIASQDQPKGTYRVRWVFPESQQPFVVKKVSAFSRSTWAVSAVRAELQRPVAGKQASIVVTNGELASAEKADSLVHQWNLAEPAALKVRYSRPKANKADRTVLRFELPAEAVSVAVEDIVNHGCVYVPSAGLFVTSDPPKTTLSQYLQTIAGKKTTLELVRAQPDQTLARAMAKTHHAIQDGGPMFVGLACDNRKYIVDRGGAIHFEPYDTPDGNYCAKVKWYAKEPDCLLAPSFGGGKGKLSLHLDGGWLPKPITTVAENGAVYQQCTYVAPLDEKSPQDSPGWYRNRAVCVAEYTIDNARHAETEVSLQLKFSSKDGGKNAPDSIRQVKDGVVAAVGDRLLAYFDGGGSAPLNLRAQAGAVDLTGKLAAGKSARLVVYLPAWPVERTEYAVLSSPNRWTGSFERYWKDQFAEAMQIDIPDPLLANAIRASQVHCFLAARNEDRGRYVLPWIASMAYGPIDLEAPAVIRGMDMCGHAGFARQGFDYFLAKRYNDRGFLTTGYTLSGTGVNLWVLAEHYARCNDREWLQSIAPRLVKACKWIAHERTKTKAGGAGVPEYGLMPPGVNGDWARYAYSFYNDAQYCHGMEMIGLALKSIEHPEAAAIVAEAQQYREDLVRAYRWSQARCPVVALSNGTWAPNHPAVLDVFGNIEEMVPPGLDSGRCWCDSVETGSHHLVANRLVDPLSDDAGWMMDYLEDHQFLRSGWHDYPEEQNRQDVFNLGGFGKVQPYYVRNAEIHAMRDDVKPFLRSYFNALGTLLNKENLSLWEHFQRGGTWNKTHETGWFLCQSAMMFAMERGDDLWLAPMITDRWMEDGKIIEVRNQPTRFGPVGYKIVSHVRDGYIEASIESPTRTPPKHVVIRIRHPEGRPMKSVTVDGKPHTGFDSVAETVVLPATAATRQIRLTY